MVAMKLCRTGGVEEGVGNCMMELVFSTEAV